MKKFIKEKYNILIPTFLAIVLLIALSLYAREYKNNRYAYVEDKDVYQYFSSSKINYKAKISRNKKGVILDYSSKDFDVSLDSTPIYIEKEDRVIFPKEMSIFFPIKNKQYSVSSLAEIYKKNNLYYLNQKKVNDVLDYAFLYDGKDLYFFIDEVTIYLKDREITLSPMSYLNCSYNNYLEYYDRENDKYEIIDISNQTVTAKNEYMNLDVSSDEVTYKNSFTLLLNDFTLLNNISEIEK